MSAVRVQRRREKGWRMPENTVYVGRPTQWGNPFEGLAAVHKFAASLHREPCDCHEWLDTPEGGRRLDMRPLRGKDLACWCPLDQPCHADVLLELANR